MIYYRTQYRPSDRAGNGIYPPIITDKKAEKVTEEVLRKAIVMLTRNQYEEMELKEADSWLRLKMEDADFNNLEVWTHKPNQEPTQEDLEQFAEALLKTIAGSRWYNMLGRPLEQTEDIEEEPILMDWIDNLIPVEGDHAGPEMHSRIMGYDVA